MTQDLLDERGVLEWLTPQINPHSGVPVYLQLTQALVRAIQRGTVRPGDSLPTVRHLAATLRLAPNTVTRAYAELQRQGLIESRAGAGTTVLAAPATSSVTEAGRQNLAEELHDLLHRMTASGLTLADLRALFEQFTLSREREAR